MTPPDDRPRHDAGDRPGKRKPGPMPLAGPTGRRGGMDEPAPALDPGIEAKLRFLSEPGSYPHAPAAVRILETHMSWVFFAGDRVFKLKKPVRYPYLDFSTLALRQRFVAEEVRLNRRLAPSVYLGARALTLRADGALSLAGTGRVIDWLVEMRRLPEDRFLDRMLEAGSTGSEALARVAETLVGFYRGLPPAEISPDAYAARFAAEHARTSEVLADPAFAFDGARVRLLTDGFAAELAAIRPVMDARVAAGRIVEGHGDLRPEHVCMTEPLAIIDCLEFSPALRCVDPFEEIAYLGLECARLGADWAFPELFRRLAEGLDDRPPPALLAFHWRYRGLLRARLALLHLAEPEPRTPEKWRPLAWRYIELAEQAADRSAAARDPG
jgi:aminoglycoside phosphotransferase family enzyme